MKLILAGLVLLGALGSGCATQGLRGTISSIGVATMQGDGTIVLQLGSGKFKDATSEGHFVYPPNHPDYQEILKHVRPIKPGESVPVKPFPPETDLSL